MTRIGPKGRNEWTERDMLSGSNAAERTTMPKLPDVNQKIARYVGAEMPWKHDTKRLSNDPLRNVTLSLHKMSQPLGKLGIAPRVKKRKP